MAQLVDFVWTNRSRDKSGEKPLYIVFRAGKDSQSRAGQGDLRGRGENKWTIRMSMTRAQFQNVCNLNALAGQVMHAVSVVPEEAEIRRRGLHRRQALNHSIGINR